MSDVPRGSRVVRTVDVTPTWCGILPVLLLAVDAGAEEGRHAALKELDRMAAAADEAVRLIPELTAALRKAEQFIENGVEFGFIRMPDAGTPDAAHDTLPAILAALAKVEDLSCVTSL